MVGKLSFDASSAKYKILSTEQQERFRSLIKRIELITELQDSIKEMCDTSFLFWHQSILKAYLKQIVDKKLDFNSFQVSYTCSIFLKFFKFDFYFSISYKPLQNVALL